ncbi:MAG: NADH-quinone oxidoreductase subunit A [Candidatus Omnitrophica bacterium]|nr:NADH-quinone oxidoreductase subunit A [Candidatus Omnitrophota bacterium]
MDPLQTTAQPVWPLAVYAAVVILLVTVQILLSHFVGERHRDRATGTPYESGVVSTGSARLRFSSTFYLIAVIFVVFDLETVYLIAWSIAVRELGWAGYLKMLVFVGILSLTLVYLWRIGALNAGPPKRETIEDHDN